MTPQPRIVSATIQFPEQGRDIISLVLTHPEDEALFKATVTATFEDGTTERVLSFYEDELAFTPEEFVGLTREEVRELFIRKDIAYLQS